MPARRPERIAFPSEGARRMLAFPSHWGAAAGRQSPTFPFLDTLLLWRRWMLPTPPTWQGSLGSCAAPAESGAAVRIWGCLWREGRATGTFWHPSPHVLLPGPSSRGRAKTRTGNGGLPSALPSWLSTALRVSGRHVSGRDASPLRLPRREGETTLRPASHIMHPASRIPYPTSRIPHPTSHIPHPISRIPYPAKPRPASHSPYPAPRIPHGSQQKE